MIKVQLSSTYKFLFDNIIGELLSQICARFPYYHLRDRKVPYSLNDKIEEYRQKANNNMSNPRLDRHKLASLKWSMVLIVYCVHSVWKFRKKELYTQVERDLCMVL